MFNFIDLNLFRSFWG